MSDDPKLKKEEKEKALREWIETKIELSKKWIDSENKQRNRKMIRGAIHICKLGENVGSEQGGSEDGEVRPVLIISNDLINSSAPNVTVIPLTKRLEIKKVKGKDVPKYRSHYFLMKSKYDFLKFNSATKAEDVITVSKIRLGEHLGNIDDDDLIKIVTRLKWVMNI